MITPEQQEAMQELLQFAKSGSYGGYTAGTPYGGSLGNFDMTPMEQEGERSLAALVNSANPEMFDLGANELKDFLGGDKFDPFNERGVYSGFKDNVEREIRDSQTRLKRGASFAKNLYSRDTINRMGDLEEQGQKVLSGKLAELYDTYANRRLSAIPMAFNAGQMEENINLGRIGAAYQYGSLPRLLNDAKDTRTYQEWLRQRGELKGPIDALGAVAGNNVQWGAKDVTLPKNQDDSWGKVLDMLAYSGANMLASSYGSPGKSPAVRHDVVPPDFLTRGRSFTSGLNLY
ncbi:MAG: hypothetical protein HY548_09995 [Elusimicrobia bacterium]|nr:hypothetical protein [Elusimicrobiota bacterium]